MNRLGKAQLTKMLFDNLDSSFVEPVPHPTPVATTTERSIPDDGAVSSDDEPDDIPNIIPLMPSKSHTSLRSARATNEHIRQRMQPMAKKARTEQHPMMDDVENDLFIPLSLEHLNGALAVPPKGAPAPAGLTPFPIHSSQKEGTQRKVARPFVDHDPDPESEPQRRNEPGDESPFELNEVPEEEAEASLQETSSGPTVAAHVNGTSTVEQGRKETIFDSIENTHITVRAEESFEQTLEETRHVTLSPPTQAPAGDREAEHIPMLEHDVIAANPAEQAVNMQYEQQEVDAPSLSGHTNMDESTGSLHKRVSNAPQPSSVRPAKQLPPVSAQAASRPMRLLATPFTPKKKKRKQTQTSKPMLSSQVPHMTSTAVGNGSPVLGSDPAVLEPAPPSGQAPKTPSHENQRTTQDPWVVADDAEPYPDASLVVAYDARHFSPVTKDVLSENLLDMTVLLGNEDWTNGSETWGSRLIEKPTSILQDYQSDACSRLGRHLLCLAHICKEIPRKPGTRNQFNYFGDASNHNITLVPKYIESIDNQINEILRKKLGRHSNTPAKSRCRVAMDLRRNIIPVVVLMLELVFLAGAPADEAGLLDAMPEHAEHTKQTLQLLRRLLSWAERLEKVMTEEFASIAGRQQGVGADIPPGMFDGQGLNGMIQKFKGAVDGSYLALNKQTEKANAPTARQKIHLDKLVDQSDPQQEGRGRAKRKRDAEELELQQQAKEEAKRRCIESVMRLTGNPRCGARRPAYRVFADLTADEDGRNGYHYRKEPQRVPHPPGTAGRAYPDEVFKRVLRALKYSQKPDVEAISEAMHYHVEDVWEVIALLKGAAEAQQRADGERMPEGLRRSFEYLYR
ncbi:hypothetical protein ACHAQH_007744 [Verticillium albo-atrum]